MHFWDFSLHFICMIFSSFEIENDVQETQKNLKHVLLDQSKVCIQMYSAITFW